MSLMNWRAGHRKSLFVQQPLHPPIPLGFLRWPEQVAHRAVQRTSDTEDNEEHEHQSDENEQHIVDACGERR